MVYVDAYMRLRRVGMEWGWSAPAPSLCGAHRDSITLVSVADRADRPAGSLGAAGQKVGQPRRRPLT